MLRKIVRKSLVWIANRVGCAVLDTVERSVIWGKTQEINGKAEKVAAYAEELLEENKQLRAAYDALLEEMAQLTEERTW